MMDFTLTDTPSQAPKHRRVVIRFGLVALLSLTFLAGMLAGSVNTPFHTGASSSISEQPGFVTLQQVWDLVHEQFADPGAIDDQSLMFGAARGMVDSLGDTGHSAFLDPDQAGGFRASLAGELIGLGISIDYRDGEPVIVAPIKNSPAEAAGLLPGDVIVAIDGTPTLGLSDTDVSLLLRGSEGTPVTLTVAREGAVDLLEITVVRARIDLDPVSWALLPGNIGIVQLHSFSAGSGPKLRTALQDARSAGATAGIVLDLRNNPGGLVSEAITVASQFMPEGATVFLQEDREGQQASVDTIGNDGAALDIPVVVLVNRASASAAEMIAGSLRDNGRAEIVGERTYGTGTVVSTFDLGDGSALALGTAFWKTPEGELIWKVGLRPDIEVRQAETMKIIDLDKGELLGQADLTDAGDLQLDAALALLHQGSRTAQ